MARWSLNNPPGWFKTAVATKRGWEHPVTKEVLVAIRGLATKAGGADVMGVSFVDKTPVQGEALSVIVRFNEKVSVTVGASIEVSWTGISGNITLNAAAQTNVHEVVFNKQANNSTQEVVPSEAGTLSVAAQTISGTIVDAGTVVASNKAISAPVALAASSYVVV